MTDLISNLIHSSGITSSVFPLPSCLQCCGRTMRKQLDNNLSFHKLVAYMIALMTGEWLFSLLQEAALLFLTFWRCRFRFCVDVRCFFLQENFRLGMFRLLKVLCLLCFLPCANSSDSKLISFTDFTPFQEWLWMVGTERVFSPSWWKVKRCVGTRTFALQLKSLVSVHTAFSWFKFVLIEYEAEFTLFAIVQAETKWFVDSLSIIIVKRINRR